MRGIRVSKSGSRIALGLPALLVLIPVFVAGCTIGGGDDTTTTVSTAGPEITTTTTMATGTSDTSTVTSEMATTSTGITIEVTTTEAVTTTTEALSSAEKRLANGHIEAMGYIDKVYIKDGKRYISIDYAEMLGGQAAIDAAIDAGYIEPGEDLPNDYWISNTNTQKRVFEVSGTVAITTSTRWVAGEDMGAACTWNDFKSFWGPAGALEDSEKHLKNMPWWIERDGQIVLKIDEQYLP